MGTAPYWWFLLLLSCVAVTALRYNYGNGSFYVGDVDEQGRPSGKGRFYNTSGTLGEYANSLTSVDALETCFKSFFMWGNWQVWLWGASHGLTVHYEDITQGLS